MVGSGRGRPRRKQEAEMQRLGRSQWLDADAAALRCESCRSNSQRPNSAMKHHCISRYRWPRVQAPRPASRTRAPREPAILHITYITEYWQGKPRQASWTSVGSRELQFTAKAAARRRGGAAFCNKETAWRIPQRARLLQQRLRRLRGPCQRDAWPRRRRCRPAAAPQSRAPPT